jgi:tetratricopeptide repeat protein/glycosyl transferase family 87
MDCGRALGLERREQAAIVVLLLVSWDFAAYALPGLVYGELWLPVACAALALARNRPAVAGVAIAWAGLVKLFPFVLVLPAVVVLAQAARRRDRARMAWALRLLGACVAATLALGLAATWSGRSWSDFLHKIVVEFQTPTAIVNSVSAGALLTTFGVFADAAVRPALALLALGALAAMFWRDAEGRPHAALAPAIAAAPMNEAIALATLGRLDVAERAFARAATLAPRDAAAQDNHGRVLMMLGRTGEAATRFEAACALTPDDPQILYVLAGARTAKRRGAEAVALLRRARELATEDSTIAAALAGIDRR